MKRGISPDMLLLLISKIIRLGKREIQLDRVPLN
uniref:Putative LRR receptor-like serine/threonine-protein kinase RLK n=1 Tax=Rhizophora mucronata TaxID=61149 RepID=A0A2P2NNF5_RHIMU